jgi:(E)-4-hydroxy-3-methyl-but-2-enyl pyrophosphate reductase
VREVSAESAGAGMRIFLAETAGFCMGVKRAMNIALATVKEKREEIYTLGPLIHNPQTVEMLKKKNVKVVEDISELRSGTVIIRAHGIGPEEREKIEKSPLECRDATCPLVLRIRNIIQKQVEDGYTIVIVGDEGHAEVSALLGYSRGKGIVVERLEDAKNVPPGKLCVVAQSTQERGMFVEVVKELRKKDGKLKVFDTICDATTWRQEEVKALAKKVDVMVVVGGRNSANTRRLAEISRGMGVRTLLIETPSELKEGDLAGSEDIGVTAGASTPNWLIEKVIDQIEHVSGGGGSSVARLLSRIVEFVVKGDVYVAVGAAALCFACAVMRDLYPAWLSIAVSGLYIFAIHVLNHYTDREYAQYKESYKLNVLEKHKKGLVTAGLTAACGAIVLSAFIGPAAFGLIVLATGMGLIYNFPVVPGKLAKVVRIKRLRDFPMSKNLGTALGWCSAIVLLPVLEVGGRLEVAPTLTVLVYSFAMVFARSTLLDLRDVQGDMMIGNETIPILIGERNSQLLLLTTILASIGLMIAASVMEWVNGSGFAQLAALSYVLMYLGLHHYHLIHQAMRCEIVADTGFLLAAGLAGLWLVMT